MVLSVNSYWLYNNLNSIQLIESNYNEKSKKVKMFLRYFTYKKNTL